MTDRSPLRMQVQIMAQSSQSKSSAYRASRREFLGQTLLVAGTTFAAPAFVSGRNLNEKLNVAIIGSGGRGRASLSGVAGENVVALCDVNEVNLNSAAEKHPQARKFTD